MTQLLTIEETAKILRISKSRCYDLVRRGLVPSMHVGKQIRVPLVRLEEYIAAGGQGLAGPGVPASRAE
jgi:excisionase family DNA binding protein